MKGVFYSVGKGLLLAVSLLFCTVSFAQTKVSGKVSAEDGSPLPGATVLVKNTTNGSLTNEQGMFTITAKSGDVLIVSFLGYASQEITLAEGQTSLEVSMIEVQKTTSEVVITALGITKEKSRLSYAVQEVDGGDLVKAREPNAINNLVGKVAGLVVGSSPELLGAPNITLRGAGAPIFVVDGVPINSDTWNISPDDIETYTVLKGPSAAALYGFRSKEGVIIITTKKGTRDKRGFAVEFNSSTIVQSGFNAIPKVQDLYGPGDHGHYAFEDGRGGGYNDGDYDVWGPRFDGQLIPQYDGTYTPDQTYTTTYPDGASFTGHVQPTPYVARGTDNLSRFLRPGLIANNNLSISSHTDKYDLRFSTSFNHQSSIVPNTHLEVSNFNMFGGYNFTKKIRLEANLNYNRQFTDNFPDVNYGPNSMIYNIIIWGGADWDVDVLQDYWQPGKVGVQQVYAEYQRYNNPWFIVNEWLRGHHKTDVYGYTTLKWDITEDLKLQGRTAVTTYDLFRSEKFPYSATVYGREEGRGDYREDRRSLYESNSDLLLTYDKVFSDNGLGINATVGGNIRSFTYNSSYVTTNYLNVPGLYNFENTSNPLRSYNFNSSMLVYSGFYSVDFSLLKYANLSATGRWDKLSTLPEANNLFFYPSFGISSVVSDFVSLPSAIDFLKIRGTYANVKDALTQAYIGPTPGASFPLDYGSQYQSTYQGPSYGNSSSYSTPLIYNNLPGAYYTNTIANPNLLPSNRVSVETGIEIRLLQNRLGVDVAYYNYVDGPQIFSKDISETSGYGSQLINAVKTRTSGLEATVTATPFKNANGFSWNILANWSQYRQVFAEFPEGTDVLYNFYKVGDRTDGYYDSGVFHTPEGEIINDASGRPLRNPIPQFLGYSNPDWVWGITNRFGWKSLSLTVQFDGRVGGVLTNYIQRQTFRGGRHIATTEGAMGIARENDTKGIKSYLGEGVQISNGVPIQYDPQTGAITNYSELTYTANATPAYLQDYIGRYYATSEANLMSKTFSKLREVTLTYTVPTRALGNSFIRGASVSFVSRNLLYFAEKKDIDIDQYIGSNYSGLQTPTVKSFGANVNLTF